MTFANVAGDGHGAVVTRVRPLSSERAVPVPCKINDVKTLLMGDGRAWDRQPAVALAAPLRYALPLPRSG